MANDKFNEFGESVRPDIGESSVRARNRTVMLTPEITGQVRARLSRDSEAEDRSSSILGLPESSSDFVTPRSQVNEDSHGVDDIPLDHDDPAVSLFSARPSNGRGANPISREVHQVASSTSERQSAPNSRAIGLGYDAAPTNLPPQRREVIAEQGAYEEESHGQGREAPSEESHSKSHTAKPSFEDDFDSPDSRNREDEVVWIKKTPIVGFLVSFDEDPNGQVFNLRSGRLIVTAEPQKGGNYLLLKDESVSPMHAILRITEDAQFQVLDNLSEYGTTIVNPENAEETTLSGDKAMVQHGDIVRFGKRAFSVCLIGK